MKGYHCMRLYIYYLVAGKSIAIVLFARSNKRGQRGRKGRSHDGTRLQLMKSMFADIYA